MKIEQAIEELNKVKKRNFSQSYDLVISIRNIDLKKPENRFSKEVFLPHGRGKEIEVGIISDSIPNAVLDKGALNSIDKKKIREITSKYEFFVCEAPLMPLVGKVLGRYLAPKGRMPKMLPPGRDHKPVIEELKKSVRIRVRDSPTIQVAVGTEKMPPEQIKENVRKVVDELKKTLPGKATIKDAYIKLTMTPAIRIEV